MSAAEKTPKAKKAATPRKSSPVDAGGDADGSAGGGRASPTDSAKKLKIFHYFGGASASESTPGKRQTATAKATKIARNEDQKGTACSHVVG